MKTVLSMLLTLPVHLDPVDSLPVGLPGSTDGLGVSVSLAQSSGFPVGRGKTTHFPVLGNRLADPLDFWVTSDGLVEGINADDLEELVGGILTDPV